MFDALRRVALAASVTMAVLAGAASAAQADSIPTAEARPGPNSQAASFASGAFTAVVDFTTVALREVAGGKCELTVNGTLLFTGTLTGSADGTTTALIFAPCPEVAVTPPGTYPDVFRFHGNFAGTVNGVSADGELTYAGVTQVGGAITATILLRGGATAILRADAVAGVGGTYAGIART